MKPSFKVYSKGKTYRVGNLKAVYQSRFYNKVIGKWSYCFSVSLGHYLTEYNPNRIKTTK